MAKRVARVGVWGLVGLWLVGAWASQVCADARPTAGPKVTGQQLAVAGDIPVSRAQVLPALKAYGDSLVAGFANIPHERRKQLEKLALYIRTQQRAGTVAKVTYICTHNSRRSHMGQLFSTLAAAYYGVERVAAFSGGTEVTAFNPRAVASLERAGFEIVNPGGDNPHYQVRYAQNRPPVEAFSKKYDAAVNPKSGFAAVMTCSHADKNCPTVAGAALRIPLHYVDPKVSDNTAKESATYDARARQIATEAFYLFSRLTA